jgi:hypothetical protein
MNVKSFLPLVLSLLAACTGWAEIEGESEGQLAKNPSFEAPVNPEPGVLPDHWTHFTSSKNGISVLADNARTGSQCVRIEAQGETGAYQGLKTELPVREGEDYAFSVYIRNDRQNRLGRGTRGALDIEWLNADGEELSRIYSDDWSRNLSRMRWTRKALQAEAPEGAASAIFGIHLLEDEAGEGAFLADDVLIEID